ncbi:MAG: type II toxin-antitoxin system CcdA family antitoxin [Desertifilum sp. SIO1I2]|nr:type II toxin-antitoxin system CcdA family antitoxin [Desertifilum sp. SIO1I2]
MNDSASSSHRATDKVEIAIHLDPELLDQLKHLTNDPSKIVETALRQWLRGETQRDDDLTRTLVKSPPVPPRGEWND